VFFLLLPDVDGALHVAEKTEASLGTPPRLVFFFPQIRTPVSSDFLTFAKVDLRFFSCFDDPFSGRLFSVRNFSLGQRSPQRRSSGLL